MILANKTIRNLLLALFAVVGVFQLRSSMNSNLLRAGTDILRQNTAQPRPLGLKTLQDGQFCIVANAVQGEIEEYERITLILHVSSDRLNKTKILQHVKNWDGPISLSIAFPPKTDLNSSLIQCTLDTLNDIRSSIPGAYQKISAHFLLEDTKECTRFPSKTIGNQSSSTGSLDDYATLLSSESEAMEEVPVVPEQCKPETSPLSPDQLTKQFVTYPVNKARNVARRFATTKYILSADLDHFFSKNFEKKMLNLAKRLLEQEPKTVLVYRIFEVSSKAPRLPETKADLHKLFLEGKAQEFHKYYGAHSIPELYDWFVKPEETDSTQVQFYRPYKSHHWEPQFVSLNNIPEHDETFFYSLRDNTVLRWEMCRAGFQFAIVEDVFMFHPGYKSASEQRLLKKTRLSISSRARTALSNFKLRMDHIYPETKFTCPMVKL